MMWRLNLYVITTILAASLVVLLFLGGIWELFVLLDQLGDVGRGTYSTLQAFQYTGLVAPFHFYRVFPLAGLLGAVIGLGMLANHSELTVMRASGVSTGQIAGMVMKAALIFAAAALFVGEKLAPDMQQEAQRLRDRALTGMSGFLGSDKGLWARDGQNFVHLRQLTPEGQMLAVTLYRFDEHRQLKDIERADYADYQGGGRWLMKRVRISSLGEQVDSQELPELAWSSSLTPNKLGVVIVDPDKLSIAGLRNYRRYLADNGLASGEYDLAYWAKLLQPIATALMMFVGMSFVFGPMRSVSMGARILGGITAGFAFHLCNEMFGPVSLVFKLPPVLGATLPILVFTGIGVWMLRRAG